MALDRIGQAGDGVVAGLVGALGDKDLTVRVSAAVALGSLGGDAAEASGPLNLLLKEDNEKLRTAAGEAIRKIASAAKPTGERKQ
jgi:HEAT repeat protein